MNRVVYIDLGNGLEQWDGVTEYWKDIPNYEGYYQASTLGRIRNSRTGRVRKLHKSNADYYVVGLYKKSKPNQYNVHKLVADTFIPNPNNLVEINHIDQDKTNNRIDNLERCNHQYNKDYSTAKEIEQYDLNTGITLATFKSSKEVYNILGFSRSIIVRCCNGFYKSSYGYGWRYTKRKYVASLVGKQHKIPIEVYNLNTGNIINTFDSVEDTAKFISVSTANIFRCLNGKQKTCKGYGIRKITTTSP